MSAAARGLSHERRALQHLQVVAELLRRDHVVPDVSTYTGLSAKLFPATGERVHDSTVDAPGIVIKDIDPRRIFVGVVGLRPVGNLGRFT